MNSSYRFATCRSDLEAFQDELSASLDTRVRFPDWPFHVQPSHAVLYEYIRFLGGDFGEVLAQLAAAYGDAMVTVLGLEPTWDYYEVGYHAYPGFQLGPDSIARGYKEALFVEPDDDITGALYHSLDTFAISGDTHQWAVYGQRDWEVAVLVTTRSTGPWQKVDIPWFPHDLDLNLIRDPEPWSMPLSEADLATFRSNTRPHGGPELQGGV